MVARLVVASFLEDLSWLELVRGWEVLVYQKNKIDPHLKYEQILLPNVGRETHSFLTYFLTGDNADKVCLVQGNPFDHSKDFYKKLNVVEHGCLGEVRQCKGNGSPEAAGIDVTQLYLGLFGEMKDKFTFSPGAQHIVNMKKVNHPPQFWKRSLEMVLEDGNQFRRGHEYERIWKYVLNMDYEVS